MEKKTNKPKLEIFKFLRKSVLSQDENSSKSYIFSKMKKMQKIEK